MCLRKDVFIMETIFPREEKPEWLFEKSWRIKVLVRGLRNCFMKKLMRQPT